MVFVIYLYRERMNSQSNINIACIREEILPTRFYKMNNIIK